MLIFSIAMTNLRYTSFSLDWINAQKKAASRQQEKAVDNNQEQEEASIPDNTQTRQTRSQSAAKLRKKSNQKTKLPSKEVETQDGAQLDVGYSLLDMVNYCLYLPLYFTGPIITYDDFCKQVCRV